MMFFFDIGETMNYFRNYFLLFYYFLKRYVSAFIIIEIIFLTANVNNDSYILLFHSNQNIMRYNKMVYVLD